MTLDPEQQRLFAIEAVQRLRDGGFVAYWAGGCVRDQLLGRRPKDYDVATSATPPQISRVFRNRKTLQVGAAFGVVVVIGGRRAGQIDVATFRHDVGYSDGRRPDEVVFSDPEQDALRRDFTINGLFFDPIEDAVIDFVGGQEDLKSRVVRAIGDPRARLAEDKLRMLRAVRFAATLGFELESATAAAIAEMASRITVVSAERITQEMRAMLSHASRAQAVKTLHNLGLLAAILPEAPTSQPVWSRTLSLLQSLSLGTFESALAGLFWHARRETPPLAETVETAALRWKLSNKELDRAKWLVRHRQELANAQALPWPRLQRLLISPGIEELLDLYQAGAGEDPQVAASVNYCRQQRALPVEKLNPPPLLTGDDLLRHGVPGGPRFKSLLEQVRDAQLTESITSPAEALALVDALLAEDRE
ncbi:MAG: CCA tRNA nucleotidyltransferase [Pirellulales bacterium]